MRAIQNFMMLGVALLAVLLPVAGASAPSPDERPAEIRKLVATLQAGFGMGIAKSHLVWMFERESALKDFINNGLVLGADVDLKVNPSTGSELYGGAVAIRPGAWLCQLSDEGLVADLTIEGTKYFKDPELN